MLESEDPTIKLFGRNIPFPRLSEEEGEEKSNAEMKNTITDQSEKDQTLKKPTKILPCPRCKSMETKFCYYNNYNVNQPRHYCKACQRYWTNGGTMRSVPVGAGRRKNKNSSSSSSHYRHINISETKGPVFSFNHVDDQKFSNNSFGNNEKLVYESRTRNSKTDGLDYFPEVSWPSTWNLGFYPVYPYWNIPMLSSSPNSNPNNTPSTTLGKHLRDENEMIERKQKNGSVLVPKTLRIDDPKEAAKSSIWKTLGIKKEIVFKGFDSKKDVKIKKEETETALILSANPAALSRSVNFHERV